MLSLLPVFDELRCNCSNRQRPRVSDRNTVEQNKRLEYLERIVQGYVGSKDALDLETLKGLAQATEKRRSSPRPAEISSQSSEFDGVDEKFDMQPLHGNVTRTKPFLSCLPDWKLEANLGCKITRESFRIGTFRCESRNGSIKVFPTML